MKVHDIMTTSPMTCGPTTNLAEVAHLMWTADCGIVPITDGTGKLLGVITDRDICIAAATQDKSPGAIRADELRHGDVYTCRPDDDMRQALREMREHRVRRLPVVGIDGTLQGMLSIRDIVISATNTPELNALELLATFEGICAHQAALDRSPQPQAGAKAAGASSRA